MFSVCSRSRSADSVHVKAKWIRVRNITRLPKLSHFLTWRHKLSFYKLFSRPDVNTVGFYDVALRHSIVFTQILLMAENDTLGRREFATSSSYLFSQCFLFAFSNSKSLLAFSNCLWSTSLAFKTSLYRAALSERSCSIRCWYSTSGCSWDNSPATK